MHRLGLLLVVSLCAAAQSGGDVSHSGIVRSSGQPIPGAAVLATQPGQRLATTTDENGAYVFPRLSPGAWTIEVQMIGFTPVRRDIQVAASAAPVEWTLEVQPRVAVARSEPAPAQSGRAAPTTTVAISPPAAQNGRSAPQNGRATAQQAGRPGAAQAGRRPGFQNVTLNQSGDATETQVQAALDAAASAPAQPAAEAKPHSVDGMVRALQAEVKTK